MNELLNKVYQCNTNKNTVYLAVPIQVTNLPAAFPPGQGLFAGVRASTSTRRSVGVLDAKGAKLPPGGAGAQEDPGGTRRSCSKNNENIIFSKIW